MTPTSEYREMPLTKGQTAIVDPSDYDWLIQWKWRAVWSPNTQSFYAIRSSSRKFGRQRVLLMHREIMGLTKHHPQQVDHANHNTLDNRRINLRLVTNGENSRNSRLHSNNKSGLKGVSFDHGRYKARIFLNGKVVTLGWRDTPEEAHILYCEAARHHFSRFFCDGKRGNIHTKP